MTAREKPMSEHQWDKVADEVNFNLDIDLLRFTKEVAVDAKILDFGCGYGRISNALASHGYSNIEGVDSSLKMIERGQREFPELSLKHMTSEYLPYPDDSFDAVICCAVFTCIPSIEERAFQISEIYRVLKPSGLLHFVEFSADPSREFISTFGVAMCHSTPAELRQLTRMFSVSHEAITQTTTMAGNPAQCYSLLARK